MSGTYDPSVLAPFETRLGFVQEVPQLLFAGVRAEVEGDDCPSHLIQAGGYHTWYRHSISAPRFLKALPVFLLARSIHHPFPSIRSIFL